MVVTHHSRCFFMDSGVKRGTVEFNNFAGIANPTSAVDLSSSETDSTDSSSHNEGDSFMHKTKKSRVSVDVKSKSKSKDNLSMISLLPVGFLDPLTPDEIFPLEGSMSQALEPVNKFQSCKQFWKAGDYESDKSVNLETHSVGIDHVRVHPKFLHSNATSHKWALGAFAELLDNALDEACNGATFVNIDTLQNRKDGGNMLLVEDNGGGMCPDKMRHCMSLGYSMKSKSENTIGQYGNGFKTSTMRLGADVIVFSRHLGKDGKRSTQSIGMLSYTFLRGTGKEDIVVPMIDYEKGTQGWGKILRKSVVDWTKNLETILQWSPFCSERELLQQFDLLRDHGTRIIIYNLWEDDQGELELDFTADLHDIQVKGVNRDNGKIEMAKKFTNSRHFLTYRHSLRSYASILYLRLPSGFRMVLRGKEIVHHNIVNDMMLKEEVTYKPATTSGVPKDTNMVAIVTIGFVKDAKEHIDIQGFNVYHKNRLIKPFWRVWNAAGSDGRGVIGVLEANFIEPAHDKQGFERTTVLSRLETRLIQMQKNYWNTNCHKIGYAPRQNKKLLKDSRGEGASLKNSPLTLTSKTFTPLTSKVNMGDPSQVGRSGTRNTERLKTISSQEPVGEALASLDEREFESHSAERHTNGSGNYKTSTPQSKENNISTNDRPSPTLKHLEEENNRMKKRLHEDDSTLPKFLSERERTNKLQAQKENDVSRNQNASITLKHLEEENNRMRKRLHEDDSIWQELLFERDRNNKLQAQIKQLEQKLDEANKEQEALIEIFSEERNRRDEEEERLRNKLKDQSLTVQELLKKLRCNQEFPKSES